MGYNSSVGDVYFGYIEGSVPLKIAVIQCSMGSSNPDGSLIKVKDAVPVLRPKAVFCVGYCGGLNTKKAKLGDVIVSSKLITYAFNKQGNNGIIDRSRIVDPSRNIATLIPNIGDGWKAPLVNAEDLNVTVRNDGVFLSGPEVVDNKERRDQLMKRFPDATAIEMEGEGLFPAARNLGIEWIVIKGVSDYADGNKSGTDSWRLFASVMAASLVAHFLCRGHLFKDWPHYRNLKRRLSSTHSGAEDTRAKVKAGKPTDEELEELSQKIGVKWESLGRRLRFDDAAITCFCHDNRRLQKKAHSMLKDWKLNKGEGATYTVLYDALCHKLVGCKLLAENFCCDL